MSGIFSLLLKNISIGRFVAFVVSNFIGLVIIIAGLFFYEDASGLFNSEDSFIRSDYLILNKRVSGAAMLDGSASAFTHEDIEDLSAQPWVREVGVFDSNRYKVWASIEQGGQGVSTMFFFESVPDKFIDVSSSDWTFRPGDKEVPIIISKDYLALYNFGFSGSVGLPKLPEGVIAGIPLKLTLSSEDGLKRETFDARITGFSSRLNTILVPESFMKWSNSVLGNGESQNPSRLIVDVNSPGDIAIESYLEEKGLESAGDKKASSASYLLKVFSGVVISIGAVFTIMSFFILLLSISLLMEKNRERLHGLLMLGYKTSKVCVPYFIVIIISVLIAYGLAVGGGYLIRLSYAGALKGLGAGDGREWIGLVSGLGIALLIILINMIVVRRMVISCWRKR